MKDVKLPGRFTGLRDTLIKGGWIVAHSDPHDTYIVMTNETGSIRCILHYMPSAEAVYPDGSWTLKLAADENTWRVETSTYPICVDMVIPFCAKMEKLQKIHNILQTELISGTPF